MKRYDIFYIDENGAENENVIHSEATKGKWVKFSDIPTDFRWCTDCNIEQCTSRGNVQGCVPHHTAIP